MSDELVKRLEETAAIRRKASASEYAPEMLHVVAGLSISDASLMGEAADAITTIRAQLAEALRERDDAMAFGHAAARAEKARADRAEADLQAMTLLKENYAAMKDRAEAALAAQIEAGPVRTGLLDKDGREICVGDRLRHLNLSPSTKKEYWFPEYEVIWDAPSFRLKPTGGGKPSDNGFAFKYCSREFETIRAQPHDRTALDRMLAGAEARGIKRAADRTLGLATGHECRTAILAMIPKGAADDRA